MSDHPHNVRPARPADRTSNSRRHRAEGRTGEPQSAHGSYAGSHRQDGSADHRSSRVGRHHGEGASPR